MIVAVESNFVIQLALRQEEGEAAQAILELAADGQIRLGVPAFALFEPYGTFLRRHGKPPDAIIFGSIDAWLKAEAGDSKVFSTKDAKAFMSEEIRGHLGKYNCRVIPSFADTLAFVEHRLAEA